MPALIALAPIISAITGVVGLGTGLYESISAQNAQSDAAAAAKKQQQQAQAQAAQQQAVANQKLISSQLPDAVSRTGGYLTETGDLGLAGAQAGLPGAAFSGYGQGALGSFLGGQGTSPTGVTPQVGAGAGTEQGPMASLAALMRGGPDAQPSMNMMQNTYGISGASA